MKYPALCPWIELEEDEESLHLTDTRAEKRWRVSAGCAPLVRGLDGRADPARLAPDLSAEARTDLLEKLAAGGLTRQKPSFDRSWLMPRLTVPLPRCSRSERIRAILVSRLLVKLWLPILLAGVYRLLTANVDLSGDGTIPGIVVGMLLGLVLHEIGHACTCIAYGGRVTAWGLLLLVILPGAFVELDTTPVTDPLRRAQIFAAGVEMNLVLTGIFLLLCPWLPGAFCLGAALSNGMLAIMNLTLAWGLDGFHILSALLDVEDVCDLAKSVLRDPGSLRQLRRQGLSGTAALAFCGMGLAMQLCLPLVLLVNLTEVILWFI